MRIPTTRGTGATRGTRLIRCAAIAAVIFAAVKPAGAQQPAAPPTSQVERLNRAPVSKEILQVKLPRAYEARLPNGITVLIMEDHRFPLITVQFEMNGAGAMYEPGNRPGLASTTAQLLSEGTRSKSGKQIAEIVDSLGASIGASARFGSGSTVFGASGLSDNFEQWFAVATDVLLHPSFPATELAQYKARAKPSLQQRRTQPNFLANQALSRALFGSYPAAVVSATPESIDALTRKMLRDRHKKRYAPQNTILAISGDVRPAELMPKLRRWLAPWKKSRSKVKFPPGPPPATKGRILLVDRPGSVQTTLLMGNLAIERGDPDYPAMVVLNEVLGAGAASRLFLNLREEKGYTYGVYSNVNARKYAGPWTAGGNLRTEVTDGAMTEFLRELNRIRDEAVPDDELDAARRAVVARFALSLESPQQLIGYALTQKSYGFPADYWDKYPARIAAITAEDVQRVATKYIDPAKMLVVAVGDTGKIRSVMEKYGTVEMVDATGHPEAAREGSAGAARP